MKYRSNLKEVKEFTFAKDFIYNFTLSLFITLLLCVLAIRIFDIRLDIVLSDSMAPTYRTGDILVIKPQNNYKVGDVVEYKKGDILVAHRIIEIQENGEFVFKGDNTSGPDDGSKGITKKDINGKVIGAWYQGEQVYNIISQNYLLVMAIIIGCWVLTSTLSGEIEIKKHDILSI